MPISTMLNGLAEEAGRRASTRTWPDDLARRQVADEAHLAGQAERAGHGAPDLGRDAEGHRRRIRDEDGLDLAAVGEAQQELLGAVDRPIARDDRGRRQREVVGERRAKLARQVGHGGDLGDATFVDPLEDLPGAKALDAARHKRGFELRPLEPGQVDAIFRKRYLSRSEELAQLGILARNRTSRFRLGRNA